jgi:Domain of unknown function (DUF4276)
MDFVHILVEGQTEEIVVERILAPAFQSKAHLNPIVVATKRVAGRPHFKGGVARWAKVENDIKRLLHDSHATCVTTLFDYYAMPTDTPGMSTRPPGTAYERVAHVEAEIAKVISSRRFIPNLVLHEVEAWVFAAANELGTRLNDQELAMELRRQVAQAGNPELINDGPTTAPSKRLIAAYPGYIKTQDGPDAISDLGVEALRAACPHVDQWLNRIISG